MSMSSIDLVQPKLTVEKRSYKYYLLNEILRLLSVIVKVGDDLRQELLAYQLLRQFQVGYNLDKYFSFILHYTGCIKKN